MKPQVLKCENCTHWRKRRFMRINEMAGYKTTMEELMDPDSDNHSVLVGECRKAPPSTLFLSREIGLGIWPITREDDWCVAFAEIDGLYQAIALFHDKSLGDLGFSEVVIRRLLHEGLKDVGDLIIRFPEDLLEIKKFGQRSLRKVEGVLQSLNLRLGIPRRLMTNFAT